MVDLESRKLIDMIESREQNDVEKWLMSYPNIKIVSRDGSRTYANAITAAHPNAIHISDRFHLVKNLNDYARLALQKLFQGRVAIPITDETKRRRMIMTLGTVVEQVSLVKYLHKNGHSQSDIMQITATSERMVKRYLDMPDNTMQMVGLSGIPVNADEDICRQQNQNQKQHSISYSKNPLTTHSSGDMLLYTIPGGVIIATLKDLIRLAKELPEDSFSEVFEYMNSVKEAAEEAKKTAPVLCIHCGKKAIKNGKNDGIQQYLCKNCRRSFSERAASAIANSHACDNVWMAVIRDTVDGVSLARTANELDITEPTVFHMRHKILNAIEQEFASRPVMLEGACEIDETYLLECEKGTTFGDYHHREPRQSGKALKQGLSNEYICLCTSVTSTGKFIAQAVNRATPSKEEIEQVFGSRIEDDTLLLADGNKSYNTLKDRCIVIKTDEQDRIKITRFHSFIKERNARARGFATKNLNRYAALFAKIFGNQDDAPSKIFELIKNRNDRFMSIEGLRAENILLV